MPGTLALLALLSPETAAKVDRYREGATATAPDRAQAEHDWLQYLDSIRAWRDAGFPPGSNEPHDDESP